MWGIQLEFFNLWFVAIPFSMVLHLISVFFSCSITITIIIIFVQIERNVSKVLSFLMLSFSLWIWCAKRLVLPFHRVIIMIWSKNSGESCRVGIGVCSFICLLLNYGRWQTKFYSRRAWWWQYSETSSPPWVIPVN
jgi:hypothetical protein